MNQRITVWVLYFVILLYNTTEARPIPVNSSSVSSELLTAHQKADSAKFFFDTGKYQAAYQLVAQSIQIAEKEGDWELIVDNYELMIRIDSLGSDYTAAFHHLKAKEKIQQNLFADRKVKINRTLRDKYFADSSEALLSDKKEALLIMAQGMERSTHLAWLLGGVVFVSLLTLAITGYLLWRKTHFNKVLVAKNDRTQQQIDLLNDRIGDCFDKNQSLAQQNLSLEKSNLVKDKLLSVISHDLRSPMSSLQSLLNLFNTNNIARKDLVDFFGKLLSRVENTITMLENLLHWSQYQLSGIEPIFEDVGIQHIIDNSIDFYRIQAEQKHIVIDNSLKSTARVHADVEMLKIILRNLISNAIKFTYAGGIITIKSFNKDSFVIVSVKDSGVGITPESQIKMFAMSNFTTPGTEKEKGTGLGLMLCKDFVEHNHGKIWVDSKVGVGSTFYFSIPFA